jgi:amino acid transporter
VNPGVFVAIFLVAIVCINYFGGIKFFGEFEFWLSSFKVIIVVGIILFSLIIACGGGPDGDARGFRYWNDPGAFAEWKPMREGYSTTSDELKRFLGFWSVMVNATFAYLGTELVGVTAGEAQVSLSWSCPAVGEPNLTVNRTPVAPSPRLSSSPSTESSSSTASASSSSA